MEDYIHAKPAELSGGEQIGFTLVYVTHNLEEAFDITTYVVVMKNGGINRIGERS